MDNPEGKIVNKQIERSSQEWQGTFDSITDMISVHDENHKLIRVNKAFAEALNMKPEDLIGRYCYEVVHGTDKPILDCPHTRTMKTKKPSNIEIFEPELKAYLDIKASPLTNKAGEILGSIHITRDVTGRKKVDQELRDSEERYRIIVNLRTDVGESIVMLQDTDQGEGIQTFVSDQWVRVTGFPREELLGTPFFNLLSPQYRQASLQRHRKKMRGKAAPQLYDMSIIRKDLRVTKLQGKK